ncbi:hypothetical protein RDWZM_005800 [Blomia tropicalis]|uniref:Pyroglutamyl-peptidase 1 n=1 Tax=Blomia tropicalis TaxID=40697 RepID=A0A9Q0M7F5_BLOTA|nr:Pyroglutamyl-peptidase 1 [Blomia tropicalis]KAJ6219988.1 hypothetical protein RDWZM_005800 [Blomia tropicalis]
MEDTKQKPTIVLTGFGLFRDYKINPSWEAVQRIKWSRSDIELVRIQIPVVYKLAKQEVDRIWSHYKPLFVIHCGVSHLAKCLTLEQRAVVNLERYCSPDINGCKPVSASCNCDIQYLYTKLKLEPIVDEIKAQHDCGKLAMTAVISNCAGEFLCEYTYRCSLENDCSRALFVHVPNETKTDQIDILANGLEVIIDSVIKQVC